MIEKLPAEAGVEIPQIMLFDIFVASVVELDEVTEIPVNEPLHDVVLYKHSMLFATVWLPMMLGVTVPILTTPMVTSIPTNAPP